MFGWLKNGKAPEPRKGMPSPRLDEVTFKRRFRAQFKDAAFVPLAVQDEVRNVARTLLDGVKATRSGRLVAAGQELEPPRQK